jgi:RND family efflux transporter MFP subunit
MAKYSLIKTILVRRESSWLANFNHHGESVMKAMQCGLILVLVTFGVTLIGCRKNEKHQQTLPPPIVQVLQASKKKVERQIAFIGKLDSPQNVQVRARVESIVEKISFVDGAEVSAGQPLFQLDNKLYEEQLAEANAMLAEAKAALGKSIIDVSRLKALVEQNAAPQRELDSALTSNEVNEANVNAAVASVKKAELNLGYCVIKAPLAGRIGAAEVPIGSLVGKGEPTLLATISQVDPIWLYCSISEVQYLEAEQLARGVGRKMGELPLKLILADGSIHPDKGKWVFADRFVDATTGTIRVRAEFPNSRKALRPGMFARAMIGFTDEEEKIVIPERALIERQGKSFVWVIGSDNKAIQKSLEVEPDRIGHEVVVLKGLENGERLVVEGLQKVREGALVQPKTADEMSAIFEQGAKQGGTGLSPHESIKKPNQ